MYRQGEFLSIEGEGVQAILPGKVASVAGDAFPYGNYVIVETSREQLNAVPAIEIDLPVGQSLYVLYAHLQLPPPLALGENVEPCQQLGAVGKSGNAGIAHLHLETRVGASGLRFESMAYYDPQASDGQKEAYSLWRASGEYVHFDPMSLLIPQNE